MEKFKVNYFATLFLVICIILSYVTTILIDNKAITADIGFIYAVIVNIIVLLSLQAFVGSVPNLEKYKDVINYKWKGKTKKSKLNTYSKALKVFYYKPTLKIRIILFVIGTIICVALYLFYGKDSYHDILSIITNIIACLALCVFYFQSHLMYSIIRHLEGEKSV